MLFSSRVLLNKSIFLSDFFNWASLKLGVMSKKL